MTAPFLSSSPAPAPERLIAGDTMPRVTETVTLALGQNLAAGAVLGRVTASDTWTLSTSAAVDGSQVPRAILVNATNATAGARLTAVYVTGEFDQARLVLGAGHTPASIRAGLRDLNIYLRGPVAP